MTMLPQRSLDAIASMSIFARSSMIIAAGVDAKRLIVTMVTADGTVWETHAHRFVEITDDGKAIDLGNGPVPSEIALVNATPVSTTFVDGEVT